MSKIIKPEDRRLMGRVKRFEKQPFDLDAVANPAKPPPKSAETLVAKEDLGPEFHAQAVNHEDIIVEAKAKAEAIMRETERQVARIRREAYEKGFAEGLEEARRKNEENLQAASQTIRSLVAELKAREAELVRMLTPRLANLATELAGKIIHREIDKDSSIVISQAEEAINRILERDKLILRVNPADTDLMKKHKAALMDMFDGIDKIEVIADAKVERGGCVVETNLVRVDAQPGSQLAAASKTLLAETEK